MTEDFKTFDDVRRCLEAIGADACRATVTAMLVDDVDPDIIDAAVEYHRDRHAAEIDRVIASLQRAGIREAADAPDPHFSLANIDVRPVPIE